MPLPNNDAPEPNNVDLGILGAESGFGAADPKALVPVKNDDLAEELLLEPLEAPKVKPPVEGTTGVLADMSEEEAPNVNGDFDAATGANGDDSDAFPVGGVAKKEEVTVDGANPPVGAKPEAGAEGEMVAVGAGVGVGVDELPKNLGGPEVENEGVEVVVEEKFADEVPAGFFCFSSNSFWIPSRNALYRCRIVDASKNGSSSNDLATAEFSDIFKPRRDV